MSVNKAILIGHLGNDPDLRQTSSNVSVANFNIATNERWKDKDGVQQDKTEWHRIVAWNRLAEICGEYLRKGAKVYVEGRIQTRKWTDKDGADRYTTEIVAHSVQFLDAKPAGSQPSTPTQSPAEAVYGQPKHTYPPGTKPSDVAPEDEQDLPF